MTRSQLHPMPEYFDRYINMTDDVTLFEAFDISLQELKNAPIDKWKALGDRVYAPGKWTVKDLLQHLIDTERIFCYRALAFSRNEPNKMLSYDEDLYAKQADANRRTIEDLMEEFMLVRQSTIQLFRSFSPEMLQKSGEGFKGPYSVAAIGFMTPGHQRWHLKVLEERYYPLL